MTLKNNKQHPMHTTDTTVSLSSSRQSNNRFKQKTAISVSTQKKI